MKKGKVKSGGQFFLRKNEMKENATNKTVLITRRGENPGDGLNALTEAGYDLFFFPTIETVFCEPENASDVIAKNFDYIVVSPGINVHKCNLKKYLKKILEKLLLI